MTDAEAMRLVEICLEKKRKGQDYTKEKNELLRNGYGALVRQYDL